MKYRTVAEAKNMTGLRLALTAGMLAPWGEAAKSVFHVKSIPFVPVIQHVGEDNSDLVAWTGIRNAPVAILNSEKPLDRWLDILMLAERLSPSPRLLPEESADRATVVGIGNEICGEWGFGWCRRAMLVADAKPGTGVADRARSDYGMTSEVMLASPARVADILAMLVKRLKDQKTMGSPYLVGQSLSAADIYWACFSVLVNPLPVEVNPMPDWARALFRASTPLLDKVIEPILFTHRDMIYAKHLKLPLDFLID